jgi:hypothetical protein
MSDLDTPQTATVWQAAQRLREWVHESPMTQCDAGADTCPDWGLAFELARLALGVSK